MEEERKNGPWLRIDLRLYQYKNVRPVLAVDATGRKCECLLIPMLQNGIRLTRDGARQTLMVMRHNVPPTDPGDLGYIIPYLHPGEIAELCQNGLISDYDEARGYWAAPVGYLRRPKYASKREYDEQKRAKGGK